MEGFLERQNHPRGRRKAFRGVNPTQLQFMSRDILENVCNGVHIRALLHGFRARKNHARGMLLTMNFHIIRASKSICSIQLDDVMLPRISAR